MLNPDERPNIWSALCCYFLYNMKNERGDQGKVCMIVVRLALVYRQRHGHWRCTGKEIVGRRNANAARVTKLDKIRNERKSGTTKVGKLQRKFRKGGWSGMTVWACDEKRRALHRKEGDENLSTREKEESPWRSQRWWLDRARDDIKEKRQSAEEVYDRATRRCI